MVCCAVELLKWTGLLLFYLLHEIICVGCATAPHTLLGEYRVGLSALVRSRGNLFLYGGDLQSLSVFCRCECSAVIAAGLVGRTKQIAVYERRLRLTARSFPLLVDVAYG